MAKPDVGDVKFTGVYSSRSSAESAISCIKVTEGFNKYPDGFAIG